jgi:hypothetical protein
MASCGSVSREDGSPIVDAIVAMETEHTAALSAFGEIVDLSVAEESTKAAIHAAIRESGQKHKTISQAAVRAVAALMEVNYQRLYEQAVSVGGDVWKAVKQ